MEDFDKMEDISEEKSAQNAEQSSEKALEENTALPQEDAEKSLVTNDGESALEEPTAEAAGEPTPYVWQYEQIVKEQAQRKKERKNTALHITAIALSVIAILSSALAGFLAFTALFVKGVEQPQQQEPQIIRQISERVVYVREDNGTSGVLTTQEVYAKCIDSVVSISVTMDGGAASGSGFIISEDGYIVTAAHVVDGATAVKVILNNDEIINATVVGADNYTDVALLKVERSGLTPIAIGKSDNLLVGDDVVAIGTPASLEYNGSLSYGKVSYLNRRMKIYDDYGNTEKVMTVIQTSALVNSGNSGCPLINDRGEAVGIVVMKLKSTYFEGMGFALPLDAAMPIIEAMKAGKDYTALQSAISEKPAVLGVTISAVRINALDVYGLQIDSFSDADLDVKSKMKVGDVITHVDGVAVSGRSDMRYILDRRAPGDKIAVTFYRGYQSMTVEVTLGS